MKHVTDKSGEFQRDDWGTLHDRFVHLIKVTAAAGVLANPSEHPAALVQRARRTAERYLDDWEPELILGE